eukprot:ANDGO_07429.mRNA.1 hypothetical protein
MTTNNCLTIENVFIHRAIPVCDSLEEYLGNPGNAVALSTNFPSILGRFDIPWNVDTPDLARQMIDLLAELLAYVDIQVDHYFTHHGEFMPFTCVSISTILGHLHQSVGSSMCILVKNLVKENRSPTSIVQRSFKEWHALVQEYNYVIKMLDYAQISNAHTTKELLRALLLADRVIDESSIRKAVIRIQQSDTRVEPLSTPLGTSPRRALCIQNDHDCCLCLKPLTNAAKLFEKFRPTW